MSGRHAVMGLLFFPRGGSAYVVRYLGPALERAGWSVSLATGSLGPPGEETNAATFFTGLDVHALDYSGAERAFEAGGDPIAAPVPMQPSYEDRAGVADVVLAAVDPARADHLAEVWRAPLHDAGADRADVLHLHHLTPQFTAARRHWPGTPIVVHLHGTELTLIEGVHERAALAARVGHTLATMPSTADGLAPLDRDLDDPARELLHTTRWDFWRHGEFWADRLVRQAHDADHLVAVSPANRERARAILGVPDAHMSTIVNGVDLDRFRPRSGEPGARRAAFRHWLVDDPHGWTESGPPGTLAYTEADLDRLLGPDDDATVLLYVGRFIAAKRVPTLVRAFARARSRFTRPGSLVIWGGHPGEWEVEHPVTVADEVGHDGLFFAGWRGHDDLPAGLAASDALVLPSVNDAYPQTPLEAMAVGLPVLACRSGGLPAIVNLDPARPTGWLVAPDDVAALADALVTVVNAPAERERRGTNALAHARAELSWDGLVDRFTAVYEQAIAHHRARAGG